MVDMVGGAVGILVGVVGGWWAWWDWWWVHGGYGRWGGEHSGWGCRWVVGMMCGWWHDGSGGGWVVGNGGGSGGGRWWFGGGMVGMVSGVIGMVGGVVDVVSMAGALWPQRVIRTQTTVSGISVLWDRVVPCVAVRCRSSDSLVLSRNERWRRMFVPLACVD